MMSNKMMVNIDVLGPYMEDINLNDILVVAISRSGKESRHS